MKARTAFFGTPAAAGPALAALDRISHIELVVTRPDQPRGRSGTPQPSPIKERAEAMGIRVVTPHRAEEISGLLVGLDLVVVVAYGQILPAELLTVPRCGFINVHFSRLPRWRGAAPVAHAILAGDTETGVDIIQLDEGMDTGPLIARRTAEIRPTDTAGTLTSRLAETGASLLEETVPRVLDGTAEHTPQPEVGACVAAKLTSSDARLQPTNVSAEQFDRIVRAFNPKPGAWGVVDGDRLKVWTVVPTGDVAVRAGETVVRQGRPIVGATNGGVELIEVQAAGKSRMAGDVWARGQRGPLVWE